MHQGPRRILRSDRSKSVLKTKGYTYRIFLCFFISIAMVTVWSMCVYNDMWL